MQDKNFTQLCVWPGTMVGNTQEKIQEFEMFMMSNFLVRVKYLTELITNPDLDNHGEPVENTGGRNDLFFYVHKDDIRTFAIKRLACGIRWWEDVIKYNNNSKHLYPIEFINNNQPTW
jgi:hypothetical protein